MGLLDDLKMASGVGLEPLEAYERAFTKGVLLGPERFAAAAELFSKAAARLHDADAALAARAAANAAVYGFLSHQNAHTAGSAAHLLGSIQHVEVPGTQDEIMEGTRLAAELHARMLELQAHAAPATNAQARADAFRRAAHGWLPLMSRRPVTFALVGDDLYSEDGLTRFFLNAGFAAMHDAQWAITHSPDLAAEHLAMSAQAFARCGAERHEHQAREQIRAARAERPCWFCGRVVQGLGQHLQLLQTGQSAYFQQLAQKDRERGESYSDTGAIYSCALCAKAVDGVAAARAAEVRHQMQQELGALRATLQRVETRLTSLERTRVIG